LFILLFNLFSADKEAAALNINMQQGWNLVSVHVDSEEPVESYMAGRLYVDGSLVSDVSSVIRRIWSYEGNWFSYPGSSSNALTHFKLGQGYWFYVAEAATINIGDPIQYTP
jgi:hypothetical protein